MQWVIATESFHFLKERIVLGGPRTILAETGRFFTCTPDACYEDGSEGFGGVLYDGFGNLMSFF
jgi:hypothetical protein